MLSSNIIPHFYLSFSTVFPPHPHKHTHTLFKMPNSQKEARLFSEITWDLSVWKVDLVDLF